MHQYIIQAMVKALKPALKNTGKAKQILDRFWSDKMALVWDIQDVHTAANEREVALTNKEGIKVLQELHNYHNKANRSAVGRPDLLHRGKRSGQEIDQG